jgi:nitrate reductase gamma subunit
LRHFRFFVEPTPGFVGLLQQFDGFFQIGLPIFYITTIGIIVGTGYLLYRRFFEARIRYISLPSDYFPLFLILGIALTGFWMRHIDKVDIIAVKELTVGILSLSPALSAGLGTTFYIHFFLVCTLLIYFPMSKLVHMAGIFLSPTRNLANNNRAELHINPWNSDFKMHHHTYEEYEDEFREVMRDADMPLDKEESHVN